MHTKAYFLLSLCLLLGGQLAQAQIVPREVEIVKEQQGKRYFIYARNTNHCPVSVIFSFEAENTCGVPQQHVLVEAQAQKQLLFELSACDSRKSFKFNYRYTYWLGNIQLDNWDKDFIYTLPFSSGSAYKVMQGYFGDYSHQGEYALDFQMPEGTPIVAMRGGTVVQVKQDSDRGGPNVSFANEGNYILIYHEDGTFAVYFHLRKNGSMVREGARVRQGQRIAYSGNTGWSSEPHLHVSVLSYRPKVNAKNMITYSTFFRTSREEKVILEKGKNYTALQ